MDKLELYNKAKDAYYNGEPIMSDLEFDELERSLGLENVGYIGSKHAKYTVKHPLIMGSLSKVQFKEEIPITDSLAEVLKYITPAEDLLAEPKLDGCSFETVFSHDGELLSCSTRGDGEYGKDITPWFMDNLDKNNPKHKDWINIKSTSSIVTKPNEVFVIRGEVLIKLKDFSKLFRDFTNPRSFVAGCLGQDWEGTDEQIEYRKLLHFVCYDYRIVENTRTDKPKYKDVHPYSLVECGEQITEFAIHLNLKRNNITFDCDVLEHLYNCFDNIRKNKSEYALDGFVLKTNNNLRLEDHCWIVDRAHEYRERPTDCVAIKFRPEIKETTIKNIEWNIGKTGEYFPVGICDKVIMDGKYVERVSLHNYNYLTTKNIGVGSKIHISLAGDIIPFVYEVLSDRTEPLNIPENTEIVADDKSGNLHLMAVLSGRDKTIRSFVSSAHALEIPGIGDKVAEKLANVLYDELSQDGIVVENIIYCMNDDMYTTIGLLLGDSKSTNNIIESLKNYHKKMTLEDVILSFCLPTCGRRASKQCANIIRGNVYDTTSLPAVAYNWALDKESENYRMIVEYCDSFGINRKPVVENVSENKIPVILTGDPSGVSEYKTKALWLAAHPEYVETTSWKECKILFTNDLNSTSGKMKKAADKGIEIKLY